LQNAILPNVMAPFDIDWLDGHGKEKYFFDKIFNFMTFQFGDENAQVKVDLHERSNWTVYALPCVFKLQFLDVEIR
jgi:hypothetical protein